MKFMWEEINAVSGDNCLYTTYRSRVYGGWIVKSESLFGINDPDEVEQWKNSSESMVFVSDPKHEWKIVDISNEILSLSIDKSRFKHSRTINVLKSLDIVTIGDLLKCSEFDLMKQPNFGKEGLKDVKNVLDKFGLELNKNEL